MNSDIFVTFLEIVGHSLLAILGVASGVSGIILIKELVKSQQLRDIKDTNRLLKNIIQLNYLKENSAIIKPRSFLYAHKNNGNSPCDLKDEIVINSIYLNENSKVFIKKG